MRLDGKVVVATGAESGIGRAIAKACATQGASVVLSGLSNEGLEQSAAGMAEEQATVCPVDIRQRSSVDELFRRAMDHFGRIDAVVANAGIAPPKKPALEVTDEEWDLSISVNLTGTYNTVTAAGRILVLQGQGGSIIATGSSTAVREMPGSCLAILSRRPRFCRWVKWSNLTSLAAMSPLPSPTQCHI